MTDPTYARVMAYKPTWLDTARHECGHAVAHVLGGVPFRRVLLAVGGRDLGRDEWANGPVRGTVEGGDLHCDLFTAAVILWAGPLAEGSIYGASTDLGKIKMLGDGWVVDRSASSPWRTARELVGRRRAAIRGLADLLVERGELSYDECAALCAPR